MDAAPDSIDSLVAATRASRLAMHALILRVRRDQAVWRRQLLQLGQRERLTREQRALFSSRAPRPHGR